MFKTFVKIGANPPAKLTGADGAAGETDLYQLSGLFIRRLPAAGTSLAPTRLRLGVHTAVPLRSLKNHPKRNPHGVTVISICNSVSVNELLQKLYRFGKSEEQHRQHYSDNYAYCQIYKSDVLGKLIENYACHNADDKHRYGKNVQKTSHAVFVCLRRRTVFLVGL